MLEKVMAGSQLIENFTFGRHETFPFRFGWLQKGVQAVQSNPEIFLEKDAAVHLGVGKNMVRSIKYWCLATKLIKDTSNTNGGRRSQYVVTNWSEDILGKLGWDPYFEDDGTLWLIHWLLLRRPCHATTWYYFFNFFRIGEFRREQLATGLEQFCTASGARRFASSTIKRDVDCLIRMYASKSRVAGKRGTYEDSLDCPLSRLGLIERDPSNKFFRLNLGVKRNLPSSIFCYALVMYLKDLGRNSVDLTTITYEESSPGRAFALNEQAVELILEQYMAENPIGIQFNMSGGLRQIYVEPTLIQSPGILLNEYYKGRA